jgi:hypothetical protein
MNPLWIYVLAASISAVWGIREIYLTHKILVRLKQENEAIAKFYKITRWSDGTIPEWYKKEVNKK